MIEELYTYRQYTLMLLILGFISVEMTIQFRIEFKNELLENTKN
ncbi:MAG: hypothetical protein WC389_18595 [Lutibacter sp.]|jgi:hypothetical protein